MTTLVVLTVADIVLLIAGLAFYLIWVGNLLNRIAGNLEESAELVREIKANASVIGPAVEHINLTGGVFAAALPLVYGMAEQVVAAVTYAPPAEPAPAPEPARPATGTRRSRLLESVGYSGD